MEIPAALGRVLVIIPTYNERDNIERIAGRVRRLQVQRLGEQP